MFPYIHVPWFGQSLTLSTNDTLIVLCMLIGLAVAVKAFIGRVALWRIVTLVTVMVMGGIAGGRLFHVFFERPELLDNPQVIFTQLDGMTFYGALGLGLITFIVLVNTLFPKSERWRAWDIGTIMVAFSYGVLRIGCFAGGCCWGRISGAPWAVRYMHPDTAMPALGIPVHPVQLYDSFVGFFIFASLIYLYRRRSEFRGQLFAVFLVLYSIGRFLTENYRGDSYRGENILFGLSMSQSISVFLLIFGLGWLFCHFKLNEGELNENLA